MCVDQDRERLTAETFAKYRKEGGVVVVFSIPEEAARAAVSDPLVMIASDGMPITGSKFIHVGKRRLPVCWDIMFVRKSFAV